MIFNQKNPIKTQFQHYNVAYQKRQNYKEHNVKSNKWEGANNLNMLDCVKAILDILFLK